MSMLRAMPNLHALVQAAHQHSLLKSTVLRPALLQPSVLRPALLPVLRPGLLPVLSGARSGALPGFARLADVTLTPDPSALPGSSTLQSLVNGLAGWALILTLAALVIGAVLWAFGSHSQNYQQSMAGRRAVLVSGVAALLVGAAPTLINFFFHTGQSLH